MTVLTSSCTAFDGTETYTQKGKLSSVNLFLFLLGNFSKIRE